MKTDPAPRGQPSAKNLVVSFGFYTLVNGEEHYHIELGRITEADVAKRITTFEKPLKIEVKYFEFDPSFFPKMAMTFLRQKLEGSSRRAVDWFFDEAPLEFLEYMVERRRQREAKKRNILEQERRRSG